VRADYRVEAVPLPLVARIKSLSNAELAALVLRDLVGQRVAVTTKTPVAGHLLVVSGVVPSYRPVKEEPLRAFLIDQHGEEQRLFLSDVTQIETVEV
jgi:hypothetical protein